MAGKRIKFIQGKSSNLTLLNRGFLQPTGGQFPLPITQFSWVLNFQFHSSQMAEFMTIPFFSAFFIPYGEPVTGLGTFGYSIRFGRNRLKIYHQATYISTSYHIGGGAYPDTPAISGDINIPTNSSIVLRYLPYQTVNGIDDLKLRVGSHNKPYRLNNIILDTGGRGQYGLISATDTNGKQFKVFIEEKGLINPDVWYNNEETNAVILDKDGNTVNLGEISGKLVTLSGKWINLKRWGDILVKSSSGLQRFGELYFEFQSGAMRLQKSTLSLLSPLMEPTVNEDDAWVFMIRSNNDHLYPKENTTDYIAETGISNTALKEGIKRSSVYFPTDAENNLYGLYQTQPLGAGQIYIIQDIGKTWDYSYTWERICEMVSNSTWGEKQYQFIEDEVWDVGDITNDSCIAYGSEEVTGSFNSSIYHVPLSGGSNNSSSTITNGDYMIYFDLYQGVSVESTHVIDCNLLIWTGATAELVVSLVKDDMREKAHIFYPKKYANSNAVQNLIYSTTQHPYNLFRTVYYGHPQTLDSSKATTTEIDGGYKITLSESANIVAIQASISNTQTGQWKVQYSTDDTNYQTVGFLDNAGNYNDRIFETTIYAQYALANSQTTFDFPCVYAKYLKIIKQGNSTANLVNIEVVEAENINYGIRPVTFRDNRNNLSLFYELGGKIYGVYSIDDGFSWGYPYYQNDNQLWREHREMVTGTNPQVFYDEQHEMLYLFYIDNGSIMLKRVPIQYLISSVNQTALNANYPIIVAGTYTDSDNKEADDPDWSHRRVGYQSTSEDAVVAQTIAVYQDAQGFLRIFYLVGDDLKTKYSADGGYLWQFDVAQV